MLSNRKLYARTSDNVCDDDEFPVISVGLRDGRVVEQSLMRPGAFEAPDLIGMTEDEVLEWSSFDATGQHPETFHELAATPLGPWSSFCSKIPGAKPSSR